MVAEQIDELSKKRAHEEALGVTPTTEGAEGQPGCAMCGGGDVKYRCPRCERITCSLACCVDHKRVFVQKGPAGKKRKVTKDKPSSKAINPHVASDWLLRFPVPFQLLVEHAAKRGVDVTLLAPGMSKRVRNTSYMDTRKDVLYWRVEWGFPSADTTVTLFEQKANDSETPFALLAQYLTKNPENASIRGKLRKYAVADWQNHILLLLRKEFTPASQPQYYRLDGNLSLESNFKRKAIVEFPVILVALKSDADEYPITHDRIEILSADESGGESEGDGDEEEGIVDDTAAAEGQDVVADSEADIEGIEVEEEVDDLSTVSGLLLPPITEGDDELMLLEGEVVDDSLLSSTPSLLIEELDLPSTTS